MEYEVWESARAKNVRITVHSDGRVVVTKPKRMAVAKAEAFAESKRAWVEEMLAKFKQKEERFEKKVGKAIEVPRLRRGTKAYAAAITAARKLATTRTRELAREGDFSCGTISIRNQKTRWGSCTVAGNLSFNYRIVHLPPELVDYLIVHELAHTKEHNHSTRFWALVAALVPEYKERRKELHRYRF